MRRTRSSDVKPLSGNTFIIFKNLLLHLPTFSGHSRTVEVIAPKQFSTFVHGNTAVAFLADKSE